MDYQYISNETIKIVKEYSRGGGENPHVMIKDIYDSLIEMEQAVQENRKIRS